MITATFTNLQGEKITDGMIMIGDAHFNMSQNKNHVIKDFLPTTDEHSDNFLKYRVFYWKSQVDFDAKLNAYVLDSAFDKAESITHDPAMGDNPTDDRTVEEKLWHSVRGLDSTYLSLTAEKMAEKHLVEVVFI